VIARTDGASIRREGEEDRTVPLDGLVATLIPR
jgi:hypothetical protein